MMMTPQAKKRDEDKDFKTNEKLSLSQTRLLARNTLNLKPSFNLDLSKLKPQNFGLNSVDEESEIKLD